MNRPVYYNIIYHYEKCLKKYGPNHRGMDWPNRKDLDKRFQIMMEVVLPNSRKPVSILDLGCGVGLLVDYLKHKGILSNFNYWGIDLSKKMIDKAKKIHPDQKFEVRDILKKPISPESIDYIIMNGLLTEKVSLKQKQMEEFAKEIIKAAFLICKVGIAFNVMSTHVDWKRKDLFHWSLDKVVSFLVKECSRNIIIRMDYGLFEYTVYVYKKVCK